MKPTTGFLRRRDLQHYDEPMTRSSFALMVTISAGMAGLCACTGGPLPNTTDALGEAETGDSTSEMGDSTSETGSDETGSDETGSDETGSDETGSDETGSDETGSDETGSDETGSDETCMTPLVVSNLTINADTPVEDLACLRKVHQRLRITNVDWTDLSHLPALEEVGELEVWGLPELANLSGTSLVEIDRLSLSNLPALSSTAGLEQLVTLGHLYVNALPSSLTIDLPVGLPTKGIEAYASNLDLLAQLQPQPSEASFGVSIGSLTVDIAGLMSCCAIPELVLTTYSELLTDFTDLQGITTMSGLYVFNAGQLTGFAGLEQLESIGTLEVIGTKCDAMEGWEASKIKITSLAGLDNLSSIDTLRLRYLFELEALAGLPADLTITTLELRNLSALGYAEAEAFAGAAEAEDPLICGLAGDPFCYFYRWEVAPCPQ
jgi:hypothetical protein